MKKHLFTLTVCSLSLFVNAQSFQKTYDISGGADSRGIATQQTTDGGYIIAADNGSGISDFYIIKTNASGTVQWNKTLGGGNDDDIFDIHQTSDGGYFISGSTKSFGAGGNDIYAVKLDNLGNISWSAAYGGASDDAGTSSIQTSDGGYIITGWTTSFGSGAEDIYILKLTSTGTIQWSRTIGGSNNDEGMSIFQTSDGGYVVAGNTASFGAGNKDIFMAKLNSSGSVSWKKVFGGTGNDGGGSIKQTTDGGFILGTTTNGIEMGLLKTDGNGVLQWNKIYTETGCGGNSTACVVQTTDGGYAFSGNIVNCAAGGQNISLIKTDNAGVIQWSKAYGGAAGEFTHSSMQQTTDGGFIITGDTRTLAANGLWDIYLIKTDAAGYSGCHQSNVVFNESSPTLSSSSGGGQGSGGTKSTSNTTSTNPLTTLTPICFYTPEGGSQGLKEFQTIANIKLYPNPATNENISININANSSFDSTIELNDMYGRTLYEKSEKIVSGENLIAVNTTNLPNGLIVAKITNISSSEQLQLKFVNQR